MVVYWRDSEVSAEAVRGRALGVHHAVHLEVVELTPLQVMLADAALVAHADLLEHAARGGVLDKVHGEDAVQAELFEAAVSDRGGGFGRVTVTPEVNTNPVAEL